MQPDKLVKSFEGDHDGMYARVLFAWPNEPGCAELSNEALEIEPDIQNAITRVDKLAELTAEGTLVIRNIPLAPEASDQFAQFLQFAHRGKDAFEGREREWWAKMSAHVLRLSGALTYLPWALEGGPEPATISGSAMSSAIRLVRDYFFPHARACLRQIRLTERHANARRVLRWLKAKSEDGGLAGRRSPGSALATAGRRRDHGIARRPVPRGVAAGENWPQRTARREAAPTMVREPKADQSPFCALAETAETPYRGRLAQFAQFPQTDSG